MKIYERQNKLKNSILYGLIVTTLFYLGCFSIKPIYNEEEKKIAEDATKKFHQLYNESKFTELYELTDQRARAVKKKEDFLKLIDYIFTNNGQNQNSTLIESKLVPHASFSEVQLLYKTSFEKSEQYEQFIWYVDDGKAGLFSYGVTSINQPKLTE